MTTFADAPLRGWAASRAMALTGRRDGPPLAVPGDPSGQVQADLSRFSDLAFTLTGQHPRLPDHRLLSERAAIAGLSRNGPQSCGGAFRFLRTKDGFLGLSLTRTVDFEAVPALVASELLGARLAAMSEAEGAPLAWAAVEKWAASASTGESADRARLLGLACTGIGASPNAGTGQGTPPGEATPAQDDQPGEYVDRGHRPLVVDLTSLWAGPLCAHLLALAGARVIKVESPQRPDGARDGPRAFFDLLHAAHRMVSLDLRSPEGISRLRRLIERADLVLEGSRPRGLRQIGIIAEEAVAAGTSWLSITARGRGSDSIGFGDDVAAEGGLVAWENGLPTPAGDALADPLTGVAAAAAAAELLLSRTPRLVETVMLDVVRRAAGAAGGDVQQHAVQRLDGAWWVETSSGRYPIADPYARSASARAGAIGSANATELR